MTMYSINPTYYQVVWTLNAAATGGTDYSQLTGDQVGGLDKVQAVQYHMLVSTTGNTVVTGTPFAASNVLLINNVAINFTNTDTLPSILGKININRKSTGVIADQRVANAYITLTNEPGHEDNPFWISGSACGPLGLTAGTYSNYPNEFGTPFTSVPVNSNVSINGTTIVFTSGGSLSNVVTQINTQTVNTGVAAAAAGGSYLQLSSTSGEPWAINGGNALTNLGFTVGGHYGYPLTQSISESNERGNMRFTQVVNQLESFSTPFYLGNVICNNNVNVNATATASFSFTVGYEHPDQVTTSALITEPDYGNVFVGTAAITRAVARGLTSSWTGLRKVFNPTLTSVGPLTNAFNPWIIESLNANALDTTSNILVISNNISVSQIVGF